MFNPTEHIEMLMVNGLSKEDAIIMTKLELKKRKRLSFKNSSVVENDFLNKTNKPELQLHW